MKIMTTVVFLKKETAISSSGFPIKSFILCVESLYPEFPRKVDKSSTLLPEFWEGVTGLDHIALQQEKQMC